MGSEHYPAGSPWRRTDNHGLCSKVTKRTAAIEGKDSKLTSFARADDVYSLVQQGHGEQADVPLDVILDWKRLKIAEALPGSPVIVLEGSGTQRDLIDAVSPRSPCDRVQPWLTYSISCVAIRGAQSELDSSL